MARKVHRKLRPGGVTARKTNFKINRIVKQGSKKKLSPDEVQVLIKTRVIDLDLRKIMEKPFGGVNDPTLTKITHAIWKTLRHRAMKLEENEINALLSIQDRLIDELQKRHPDKNLLEFLPAEASR